MQYLTLVDFLAKIIYRQKNCLSIYGISEPSSSSASRVTQKAQHVLNGIVFKYDDASQFVLMKKMRHIISYVDSHFRINLVPWILELAL